jgi:hypothetical protein
VANNAAASGITDINTTAAAYNPALIPDHDELRTAVLKRHAKLYPNQQKSSMPLMAIMAITQDAQDHSLKPAFSLAATVHVTFDCVCLTNQKLAF